MKKIIALFVFVISTWTINGQDAHFSQFNNSKINTNPAFTGTDSTLVIASNMRLQWPSMNAPYRSVYFSADKYIRAMRTGLGINYLYDYQMQGAYTKTRIDFNYAPHFELFDHRLALVPCLQMSYFQNKLDYSKLTFGDQIDERRGFVYDTHDVPGQRVKSNIDISAGLLMYAQFFYAGVAVHHLTQPDEGMIGPSKLPMKITLQGGINLRFRNDWNQRYYITPSILYMKQQDFTMLMPGVMAKYKFISGGISYRNKDAFIATIAFQNKFLRVGYSYDYTISKLTNKITGGAHEIGLSYYLNFKRKYCQIKTLRLI
jgi:type IX secretion system PorP/SprF family membrane protein